jgi:hypothetical protein
VRVKSALIIFAVFLEFYINICAISEHEKNNYLGYFVLAISIDYWIIQNLSK